MNYNLPTTVEMNGKEYKIRNECDYRVVLDVIDVLSNDKLDAQRQVKYALYIFYEDYKELTDYEAAVREMLQIISIDENNDETGQNKPRLMDWQHDFNHIAPAISRIIGYDVRSQHKYTHWWTFIGGYMEMGECTFSNIVSIRNKKIKGIKLEKYEETFYRENRKTVDLPPKITAEEQALLEAEW